MIFTSSWASGINAYAVVFLLGLFGVTGMSDEVPEALQRTDVLIAAGVLFLVEAVADKVPYLDTAWDALHTVVRPIAGSVVAALLAGQDGSLPELAAGAVGGTTALVSHLVKAGTRMAVNTSPEPGSNILVSLLEDLAVAGLVTFALFHPVLAATIAGALLVLGTVLVILLIRRIRRTWRALKERFARRRAKAAARQHETAPPPPAAPWPGNGQ